VLSHPGLFRVTRDFKFADASAALVVARRRVSAP
jgi:hypothetical protein